jgi:hypothetical protein
MEAPTHTGRIIGVFIILQMIGSGMVNFVMEGPLSDAPGFLVNAAAHSQQIALAVLLALVTEALWVGIAVMAYPVFVTRARTMALWFVALAIVSLAVGVVENIGVMSMVSLSETYSKATAVEREQLQAIRVVVESARDWPHFISRIFVGGAIFSFYALLYRFASVPRLLAAFGLIASVLMITAVTMPLFGHKVIFPMLAPMGLSQLILAVWLITKGFRVSGGRFGLIGRVSEKLPGGMEGS